MLFYNADLKIMAHVPMLKLTELAVEILSSIAVCILESCQVDQKILYNPRQFE